MRFNDQYISFPPYISASWNRIAALSYEGGMLLFHLEGGQIITIPGIKPEIIELIFKAHASYLEKEKQLKTLLNLDPSKTILNVEKLTDLPVKLGLNPFEGLNSTAQHNPAFANAPDLPKDVLHKIASITKAIVGEESENFPKGEPHCNCFYCQIAKELHNPQEVDDLPSQEESVEEEAVKEEELGFQQWDIKPNGEKLYSVTNKLDRMEQYNVYLGNPVGCTCGQHGCEHILAVLRT